MTESVKHRKTPDAPQADPRGTDARHNADQVADGAGLKAREKAKPVDKRAQETGGPKGLEPTRYGDWEKAGRCIDF